MPDADPVNPNLILPVGTRVVARVQTRGVHAAFARPPGAVGVVIKAPPDHTHAYRVRFPDGGEIALHRHEIAVLSHLQHEGLTRAASAISEYDLGRFIIYRCIVGSRAYGLDTAASDIDRRGVYLPPAELHWSLYGVPTQIDDAHREECYWELQWFLTLALKANPNVLECLYTPLVEHAAPAAVELREMRGAFLSRLVYQTYNGYVMSQFKKIEADLRNHKQVKWKHAMHLIRLLLSGLTALREAAVPVRVVEHRDKLLAIRDGQMPWAELDAWRISLHREFDAALPETSLPAQPDYARVNDFLIRARRSMV